MSKTINENVIDEINVKELWENTLVDIELSISKANFSTWFKNTRIYFIHDKNTLSFSFNLIIS